MDIYARPPIYRKTPLLQRDRGSSACRKPALMGKSDYIPCIAWGRNARYASGFRSRCAGKGLGPRRAEYTKKLAKLRVRNGSLYEVSVSKLECAE